MIVLTKTYFYIGKKPITLKSDENGFFAYQLNKVKVKHEKGKAVETRNINDSEKLKYLYIWHFIWSKYYFLRNIMELSFQ